MTGFIQIRVHLCLDTARIPFGEAGDSERFHPYPTFTRESKCNADVEELARQINGRQL